YSYDDFPSDIALAFDATYAQRPPLVRVFWVMPDGTRVSLGEHTVAGSTRYVVSQDQRLEQRLGGLPPEIGLFTEPRDRDPLSASQRTRGAESPSADRRTPLPARGHYEVVAE